MKAFPLHSRFVGVAVARWLSVATAFALVLGVQGPAHAQQGLITGRVTDRESREPLSGVVVELVSGLRTLRSATTGDDGQFQLTGVSSGRYSLVFSSLGYETLRQDGISAQSGVTTSVGTVELVSVVFKLNPVVVTASRAQEKALESPASVYTVNTETIEERPATTAVEHIRGLPGADIITTGLAQHNVVARGFNNVFSGALFVLTDNRWASVPSLRFNAYNLIPVTNEDIDRIEFVLGPGSALYGPNVDKGVMHLITRSPLDYQGTTLSVTGGERAVFQGAFRHAGLFSDNVGYKVSGLYFRGDDWKFVDPFELTSRDFDQERFSGDLRLDFRLDDRSTLILNGGASRMISSIEMTGIGAAQALDWTYSYAQARFRRDRLFAQAYINLSDAGDSFTLRDNEPVTDNSLLYVGQIQHGLDVGERQSFTYGADLIRTVPRTDSIITGRNEEDDAFTEVGGYVQSETMLSPQLDLVVAARLDYHSVLDDVVFSPRAALVFKPTQEHSIRLTYNRAFSQPSTNNMFLDKLSSPDLGGLPFPVRGRGAPAEGFTFARNLDTPVGPCDLCMRSPFTPAALGGPITYLPLDATIFWDAAVQIVAAQDAQAGALLGLFAAPTGADVNSVLRRLNASTFEFDLVEDVADIEQTKSMITNTFEVGYKGLIGDRLLLGVDVYYSDVEDFIGPLIVETPNVFMEPQSLGAYVGAEVTRLVGLGVIPPEQAQATAVELTTALAGIPLGIVTPEQVDASIQGGLDPTTIILAYRNFPNFDIWGFDIGATLLATDWLSFSGSYSFSSEDFFTAAELGAPTDLALNSPRNKASLAADYHNERVGLSGELRGRYVDGFPVQSGVYIGRVKSYTVIDAQASLKMPFSRSTEVTLTVPNLLTFYKDPTTNESVDVFSGRHREMVGAPVIGRLVLLRVKQSF